MLDSGVDAGGLLHQPAVGGEEAALVADLFEDRHLDLLDGTALARLEPLAAQPWSPALPLTSRRLPLRAVAIFTVGFLRSTQ